MTVLISVLVVEDDASRADGIRAALSGLFDVSVATSEEQAFQMAKRKEYDTLVTAYRLPEINGIALLKRVQEVHSWLTGVVLVSPAEYAGMQERIANVRCLALLTPLSGERLRELTTRAAHLGKMKQSTSATRREVAGLPSRKV